MSTDILVYPIIGITIALTGFGYYAMEIFRAYKEEKRKIEEDFELSQKYAPENAFGKILVFTAMGLTGVIFAIVMFMLLTLLPDHSSNIPNSYSLVAKFIFIMGVTALIANMARVHVAKPAIEDLVYEPKYPDNILNEKNMQKRDKLIEEYYKEHEDLHLGPRNFGRHMIFMSMPDTMIVYSMLITDLLLVFTGIMRYRESIQDISQDTASMIFNTGLLYLILAIPAIFSMKKSAEIPMTQENFLKKVLVAFCGFIPSIIGLMIMMYSLIPLVG